MNPNTRTVVDYVEDHDYVAAPEEAGAARTGGAWGPCMVPNCRLPQESMVHSNPLIGKLRIELGELRTERARLQGRVEDLLQANNRAVEDRRRSEGDARFAAEQGAASAMLAVEERARRDRMERGLHEISADLKALYLRLAVLLEFEVAEANHAEPTPGPVGIAGMVDRGPWPTTPASRYPDAIGGGKAAEAKFSDLPRNERQ
jgi:hypothetical protein